MSSWQPKGLPVRNHVTSLRIPGAKVGTGERTAAGSVVIPPGRLLASIGKYAILDTGLRPGSGGQELAVSGDDVRIRFDVASVLERGTGSVEIHYRLPLESSVLSQLTAANGPVTLSHAAEALLNPWLGTYGGGGPRTGTG